MLKLRNNQHKCQVNTQIGDGYWHGQILLESPVKAADTLMSVAEMLNRELTPGVEKTVRYSDSGLGETTRFVDLTTAAME